MQKVAPTAAREILQLDMIFRVVKKELVKKCFELSRKSTQHDQDTHRARNVVWDGVHHEQSVWELAAGGVCHAEGVRGKGLNDFKTPEAELSGVIDMHGAIKFLQREMGSISRQSQIW